MGIMVKQPHGGSLRMIQKGEKTPGAGRPKKSWGTLKEKLENDGIEPVGRESYVKVIKLLMSCNEKTLKEILSDSDTPMWIRWIIKDLDNSKSRARLMEDLRNYVLGDSGADLNEIEEKPTQTIIHHHHKIMKRDEPSKETDTDNIGAVE